MKNIEEKREIKGYIKAVSYYYLTKKDHKV